MWRTTENETYDLPASANEPPNVEFTRRAGDGRASASATTLNCLNRRESRAQRGRVQRGLGRLLCRWRNARSSTSAKRAHPSAFQDTPRVNPRAVPDQCAPPALRDLREAGGSHGSRDAGAEGRIRDTLTSHGDGTEPPMRAARVPALFAITPNTHSQTLAAQRGHQPPRAAGEAVGCMPCWALLKVWYNAHSSANRKL
jgi:hypothetical protein